MGGVAWEEWRGRSGEGGVAREVMGGCLAMEQYCHRRGVDDCFGNQRTERLSGESVGASPRQVQLMKLVEVIRTDDTSPAIFKRAMAFGEVFPTHCMFADDPL